MKMVKLQDVAPAKSARLSFAPSEVVWQLNLDQVESRSGRILSKVMEPVAAAGSSTHYFDEGNVLYSKLRPYLNKVVCPDSQGIATTELVPLRPDPNMLDRLYLTNYLRSQQFVKWVSNEVAGAKMPRVSMKVFWNHEIPLPPLAEQKRIAAILDAADALRAKRRESLAQLDTLLQSTFLDMFGDPVTNPKGWEVQNLSEVCAKITDGTHHSPPICENGIPYITAKHLKKDGLKFHENPWFVSPEDHADIFARCNPELGDVLYIKDGATTGIAAVNRYDFEFSMLSSLALLKPSYDMITSEYLTAYLNNERNKSHLLGNMGGAAIKRLTLAKIKKFRIPIPPIDLQRRFATIVESVEQQKARLRDHLAELDTLFASLQQRAFNGDLSP